MALALNDRVQQTGTANTTVSFTLTGSVVGFQSFAVVGNGNTTYYSATDTTGNWEVGVGTYSTTGPTLTRTTILASSNSGSAVTFSGTVNVWVTYPSEKSVNLDGSGNVSALGTVASGTWQGSTVGVAYGGTGVTSSSGANSVVLRDANQNTSANHFTQSLTKTTSAAGTTVLTLASSYHQILTGSTTQTYQLPDATTLPTGYSYLFDNDSTGNLFIINNASGAVDTVAAGGYAIVFLENNATVAGEWGRAGLLPNEVNWGTLSADLGNSVITNAVWNGTPVASGYGGTGLTTFTAANNALYSTSSSALAAGTLPVAAGGTGQTTFTAPSGSIAGLVWYDGTVFQNDSTTSHVGYNASTNTFYANNVNFSGTVTLATALPIAQGGTGQTTANAAFNALAPSQSTNSGKYLTTDGTNTSWATVSAGDPAGTALFLSTMMG